MFGSQPPQNLPLYPPGTPQPEWQQQPPANQAFGPPWQAADHAPPPPPPRLPPPPVSQSSSSSYDPGTYGPMPGTGASPSVEQNIHVGFSHVGDTSSWGGTYGHQQPHQRHQSSFHGNHSTGPPLPPRPSSALDHSQLQSSSQSAPWPAVPAPAPAPTSNQQFYQPTLSMNIPEPHTYYSQQQDPWQTFQDPNFPGNQPIPPPPPPVPPAYQAEQQQISQGRVSHSPYSDQSPTHQYDPAHQKPPHPATSGPTVEGQYTPAGGTMYGQPQSSPPSNFAAALLPIPNHANTYTSPPAPISAACVTPQSPPVVSTASALGSGGPSDWEHFSARQEEIDDTAAFNFKSDVPPKKADTFELPSDTSPRTLSGQSNRAGTQPTESPDSYAVAGPTRKPSPSPPISPHIHPTDEPDKPLLPKRADSMASSIVSNDESTIIDGVIQAWSNPAPSKIIPLDAIQTKDSTSRSSSLVSEKPRIPSPPTLRIQTPKHESPRSMTPKPEQPSPKTTIKVVDLYEDLDPWYKSSLSRYVTMLRKEMAAESDEERFRIFTHFLNKEAKLREILYGVEDTTSTLNTRPLRNLSVRRQSLIIPELNTTKLRTPLEDSDDVVEFSPGGRPILASALSAHTQAERATTGDGLHRSASHPTPPLQTRLRHSNLASQDCCSAISTGSPIVNFPRSVSVPPGASSAVPRNQSMAPFLSQPTRPAYTPFRYAEGPQRGSGPLTFDRPAFQAYSALRQASVASGRTLAHPAASSLSPTSLESPSMGKAEHGETFIGLIREKSVAYRGRHKNADRHAKSLVETSLAGNKITIFDGLRDLLPTTLPNPAANPDVIELRKELEVVQGDFDFIQKSIDAWDEQTRLKRPELDHQRRVRQEESEHHIDGLFNDKEIGYSDINVLEDEFRQTEAQRQLTEERMEFGNYLENVFKPTEKRLKDDISRLQAQYDRAIDMLNADTAASDLLPGSPKTTKYELSHVMQIAVELFQKLEVRYAKQTEAILERERRRKTTERRYYVFLGETSSLKQLDADFDAMEKSNILDAAKEKDNRANTLMDSFDDASMRGLGENQSFLDDIAARVKRINAQYINSLGQVPADLEQIIASALAFVKYLGTDSESILQSFGAADRALNDADYEASVSEARVSNADPDIFHRLEEEKKNEDVKIHDDLQTRLDSVRMGHEALMANLREALNIAQRVGSGLPLSNSTGDAWTGSSPTPMTSVAERPPPVPPKTPPPHTPTGVEDEQQQRHRKALEDAKRRNAARGMIP